MWLVVFGVVARVLLGQADRAVVDHLDHFVATQVEVHDETLDRARVAVVLRRLAHERDATCDPPVGLGRVPERTRGPRVDLDPAHVGDATTGECRDVLGVLEGREHRVHGLGEPQRRPHALDLAPLADLAGSHRDDGLQHQQLGAGHHQRAQLAIHRIAGLPLGEHVLVGLVEHDVREAGDVSEATGGPDDLHRPGDLVAGDHGERMQRRVRHPRIIMTPTSGCQPPAVDGAETPSRRLRYLLVFLAASRNAGRSPPPCTRMFAPLT